MESQKMLLELEPNSCCCGCSLRQGSTVVAATCLLLNTLAILFCFALILSQEEDMGALEITAIALAVFCVLNMVTCFFLLYGTVRPNRTCLLPFLVIQAIVIIIGITLALLLLLGLFKGEEDTYLTFFKPGVAILCPAFGYYHILVVWLFSKELAQGKGKTWNLPEKQPTDDPTA